MFPSRSNKSRNDQLMCFQTVDEIPFQAIFGVYGSWIGVALVVIVLVAQVRNLYFHITLSSLLKHNEVFANVHAVLRCH